MASCVTSETSAPASAEGVEASQDSPSAVTASKYQIPAHRAGHSADQIPGGDSRPVGSVLAERGTGDSGLRGGPQSGVAPGEGSVLLSPALSVPLPPREGVHHAPTACFKERLSSFRCDTV